MSSEWNKPYCWFRVGGTTDDDPVPVALTAAATFLTTGFVYFTSLFAEFMLS
jgi:hypothetical protein